ncbi:MAG: SagB family peptide dehydrogenase [Candidatus Acidiferrales bacterium]
MKNVSRLKYRRSPFLVSYWSGKQFIIENFATAQRVGCDPLAGAVLSFFHRWRSFREFLSHFSEYQSVSLLRSLSLLVKHSLLERSDRKPSPNELAMQSWAAWNPAAGFFHFSTKDVEFEADSDAGFAGLQRLARLHPKPLPVKRYPHAKKIQLDWPRADSEFPRVLLSRRTWRKFSNQPVDLPTLGALLGLTWGVQGWIDIPRVGPLAIRTSPSGGSLHPIEAYLLVRNVRGLPPGLYHYDGSAHRLALLRRGANSRQLARYLEGQWWFGGASFLVFMTAVFARTQWKYDYPRAYRAVLMEAGHFCQTFCLAATWLGLGPFCTIAFNDSSIERMLGVDGISESVLYAAGAGTRPPDETQAHLGTMRARVRWRR